MHSHRLWELLVRKFNNEISPAEKLELDEMLNQNHNSNELIEIFSVLKKLGLNEFINDEEIELSRQRINKKIKPVSDISISNYSEGQGKKLWPKIFAWAAAAIIIIAASFLFFQSSQHQNQIASVQTNEILTGSSKSKIKLPDGSVVVLNKGSVISYNKDFGITQREIKLKGEAYFDIAHNADIPLYVIAGPVKIKVKGTAFNVKAYNEDSVIEADLIRGSIEIISANDPGRSILMRPNEKIVLNRYATKTINTGNTNKQIEQPSLVLLDKINLNPADSTINEIIWLKDKLVFNHEPFYSVAQKIEKWYNVDIIFQEDKVKQLYITGSLEKENLPEALDALSQLTPFDYSISNNKVFITNKAKK